MISEFCTLGGCEDGKAQIPQACLFLSEVFDRELLYVTFVLHVAVQIESLQEDTDGLRRNRTFCVLGIETHPHQSIVYVDEETGSREYLISCFGGEKSDSSGTSEQR